jgi:protein-tyrosine phosphatase
MDRAQKVLFVCLGNICRSPLAQAIFNDLLKREGLEKSIVCESRGLSPEIEGAPYDQYAVSLCEARKLPILGHSRPVNERDAHNADYILVADQHVLELLLERFPDPFISEKIRLLRFFCTDPFAGDTVDIPDPFDRGLEAMEETFQIIENACAGLLASIRSIEGL